MKLKNKKTGEIATLTLSSNGEELLLMRNNELITREVKLADLNEWEDYEEPKEYWHIDFDGSLMQTSDIKCDKHVFDKLKEIGNYFETEEEAEKAVRKLEAWKLLKDMGFKIEGIRYRDHKSYIEWSISQKVRDDHFTSEAFNDALHLVFGGEE